MAVVDYYKIGQRIRLYRKQQGLSQEELAEKVNISTTHMSHIETANTKLSLPVWVDIAQVLGVRADDLLEDNLKCSLESTMKDLSWIIGQCSEKEAELILEIAKIVKSTMGNHDK